MSKNSNGMSTGAAILCTLGILLFIGWIIDLGTPKCIKSGCDNDAKEGSNYCYLHDNSYYSHGSYSYSYSGSSGSTKTTKSNSSNSNSGKSNSSTSSYKSTYPSNSSSSKNTHSSNDSYDDGYSAIYEDDDYDWDRYMSDDDYAAGVDDAIEDEEEWE